MVSERGSNWWKLSILDRKLLRDLKSMFGQALAIASVIAGGVALFLVMAGMLGSLKETRRAYYERYGFADIWAPVVRAPEALIADLRRIPGVQAVETRVRSAAILDMPGMSEPATGDMLSLPDDRLASVNRIHLTAGRLPSSGHRDEVVVLDSFARAHGLSPGDEIHGTIYGRRATFHIVGTALSPEHIYAIAPGQFIPDDRLFAALWMSREALAFAVDQDGAFNEVNIRLMRGANGTQIIDALDRLLAPYGAPGAYGRDGHMSDMFLSSELNQLSTMAAILPPIFLAVAAFLVNIVISRVIAVEREQIGLLKAFGYSDRAVLIHYLKFVGAIAAMGLLMGCGLGVWLGRLMADMYATYFHFPFLLFQADAAVFAVTFAITFGAIGGGAWMAARAAARLEPAVAMTPAAPPDYSKAIGARITGWKRIDQQSRMILRQLFRFPWRGGFTMAGVAASIMLLVSTLFFLDSMQYMIEVNFNVTNRHDVAVTLVQPRPRAAFHALSRAPGVMAMEPYRAVPVRLRHGPRMERASLTGLQTGAQLSRLVDLELDPIEPPPGGLVLSRDLAEKLDVVAGDRLEIEVTEGQRPKLNLSIAAVTTTFIGSSAQMRIQDLNRLLGEPAVISGAFMTVDSSQNDALFTALKTVPGVAGVGLQSLAAHNFREILDQSLGWSIVVYTLFAGLIALGVIYNSVRISFAERARELASLRVIGFTRGEVSYVLLGEIAFVTLLALPVGCLAGAGLAWYLADEMSSDMYRLPFIIDPATFANAVGVVVVIALGSGLIVRRQIDQLDLVAVLKTRE
jgi:putative ABC transport system permease protein